MSSWYAWNFYCTIFLKSGFNFLSFANWYLQDNVFIISNPKSKYPVLQLDLRFTYCSCPVSVFFLSSGIICMSGCNYEPVRLITLSDMKYLQIDIRSCGCHCFCNLWWHCLCLCWTTGLIINIALLFSVDVSATYLLKVVSFTHSNLQVMTGYLLAGSIIGPGGLSFVSEMVQVCCLYSSLVMYSKDFSPFF